MTALFLPYDTVSIGGEDKGEGVRKKRRLKCQQFIAPHNVFLDFFALDFDLWV
jgi:hypothetical protein